MNTASLAASARPSAGATGRYGVISAHSRSSRKFTAEDSSFIQSVANIIAQAVERLASEQALRGSEEYYRSVIQNSSDGITVIDRDGVVRLANTTGYTMFGYEPGDPDAVDGRLMVHPDDRESVRNSVHEVFVKGASTNECRIRRKDGTWAYCEVKGSRIADFQGQPVAVFNTRDISNAKRRSAPSSIRRPNFARAWSSSARWPSWANRRCAKPSLRPCWIRPRLCLAKFSTSSIAP